MHFYFKIIAWLIALIAAVGCICAGAWMFITGTSQTILAFILIAIPTVAIVALDKPLYDVIQSFDERSYLHRQAGGHWSGVIPAWHIMQFSDMSTLVTPKPVEQGGDVHRTRGLDVYLENESGVTRLVDGEVSMLIPSQRER
jgi:hypothetical protein